jgi:hypothetical protein
MYLIINLFSITALLVLSASDVYGGEVAPARVNNVQCNGDEAQLVDCPLAMLTGSNNCATYLGPARVACRG